VPYPDHMNAEPLNLLLIEDDTYDVKVIRLMLAPQHNSSPFDVRDAQTLADGLVSLAERAADVVLLDLNLPDSGGLETFRRVIEQYPQTPIIVISGTDDLTVAVDAVHMGGAGLSAEGRDEP